MPTNSTSLLIDATKYDSSSRRRAKRRLTSVTDRHFYGGLYGRSSRQKRLARNQDPIIADRQLVVTDFLDLSVSVNLLNAEPIEYEAPPVTQSIVKCEVETQEAMDVAAATYAPIPVDVTGTCNSTGYMFTIECPGIRGTFNNTCPSS